MAPQGEVLGQGQDLYMGHPFTSIEIGSDQALWSGLDENWIVGVPE
jgi:hypothetical protein